MPGTLASLWPSFLAYLQPISMSIPDPQDRHITKYEGCTSCSKGEKSCKTIKHWTPCSTPTGPSENGSIGIKHTWFKKSNVRVCWIKGSLINQWASVGTRNAEREEGAGVCIRKACGNDKAKEIHRSWRARVERQPLAKRRRGHVARTVANWEAEGWVPHTLIGATLLGPPTCTQEKSWRTQALTQPSFLHECPLIRTKFRNLVGELKRIKPPGQHRCKN